MDEETRNCRPQRKWRKYIKRGADDIWDSHGIFFIFFFSFSFNTYIDQVHIFPFYSSFQPLPYQPLCSSFTLHSSRHSFSNSSPPSLISGLFFFRLSSFPILHRVLNPRMSTLHADLFFICGSAFLIIFHTISFFDVFHSSPLSNLSQLHDSHFFF